MYKLIVQTRSKILVYLTHQLALPILRIIRKPEKFPYSKEALLQMPEGTLGKDLVTMLDKKELQLLSYYAKHDIKHILLQYDTTDDGEVCLQCFMLGNGHISFPVFITVVFGFITMPEYWAAFKQAYRKGKCSPVIEGWKWFELIPESTQSLIDTINQPTKR